MVLNRLRQQKKIAKEKKQHPTMIKQTLNQAWTMMKQHKLFTGIYIAGTALSVTMIMITFAVLYIKFAPIYPEENRDRMLILPNLASKENESEQWAQRHFSPAFSTLDRKSVV